MLTLIIFITSYLLGSIPFGFIIVYAVRKTDIRTLGSGNIGATNVTRFLGKKWGVLVFILDFLKGFMAPVFARLILSEPSALILILSGVISVCGHNWPVFLKFKGGKGVSTSLGVIAGLTFEFPALLLPFIVSLLAWVIVYFISKIVSIASLVSSLSFFVTCGLIPLPLEFKIFAFLLFIFIVLRHRSNIKNIFQKKEHRF